MGIGKTLKKASKSLKKGAKKATKEVGDAAKKTAEAATDAAKKTAEAAEKAASEAERIGASAGALAENAYDDALRLGEAAWNETVAALERWLFDGLVDLLLDAAMAVFKGSRPLVDAMFAGGRALLGDPKAAADFERVVTAAASKKRDPGAQEAMRSLLRRPEIQAIAAAAGSFDTLSLGLAGSAAYGAGAEGCFGYAATLPDAATIGGFYGVGGVAVSVGASTTAQLGVWTPRPADLKGPYFAATLEVEVEGGGGIQVIFALPADEAGWLALTTGKVKPSPVGIVVFLGGGGEVSASVSGGYTWVF
ncbi:hypothetical protein [Nannocystis punicea]|uniref:Uncharacterized protein n=1 Tax=Nannocystis punicea TaxID=2995304 RepID=A0ABY7GWA1_9BACT|nr:hypothetical protein [Nannocystis poenicansa]WAS91236.1 hypothetical protein O0S08_34035 [Nannocystis poenicansa]